MKSNYLQLVVSITLVLVIHLTSCKKGSDRICDNLKDLGKVEEQELFGQWEFERFAQTRNGKGYEPKDLIDHGHIIFTDSGSAWFSHANSNHYNFTIEGSNEITFFLEGTTYVNPPQEELDLTWALEHALCYAIVEGELLIHYNCDECENNLLVFERKMTQ